MSADQWGVWLLGTLNVPFLALLAMGWVVVDALRMAHAGGRLDMANMFKDEAGKESGLRFAILGAWVISSWYLMADLVSNKAANWVLYALYLATWSGAPVFVRVIEKWDGKHAWSK